MLQAKYIKQILRFNVPGGTSRGVLTQKPSWFIKIWDDFMPEVSGTGEVSIIPGLSPDDIGQIPTVLDELCGNADAFVNKMPLHNLPAVQFAVETALIDLKNGGRSILYASPFTQGKQGIIINGLVWMGKKGEMLTRLIEKVDKGFTCIKIKVGAINFNDELELLKFIRKSFAPEDVEIRVDANGAFAPKDALSKIEALSKFKLHSIEQPIKQKQWSEMSKLCAKTTLPIALDEELIGISDYTTKKEVLQTIKPQYIILKPSLLGGLNEAQKWVGLAKNMNIGWWATSALEGNIGLNAIAQWTFIQQNTMPQGLGTGQVFSNNIESPLEVVGEKLWYKPQNSWALPL